MQHVAVGCMQWCTQWCMQMCTQRVRSQQRSSASTGNGWSQSRPQLMLELHASFLGYACRLHGSCRLVPAMWGLLLLLRGCAPEAAHMHGQQK